MFCDGHLLEEVVIINKGDLNSVWVYKSLRKTGFKKIFFFQAKVFMLSYKVSQENGPKNTIKYAKG